MVETEELRCQFSQLGVNIDEDLLTTCSELCITYNLSEVDLVESWVAFTFSTLDGQLPTIQNLKLFEQKELSKAKLVKTSKHQTTPVPVYSVSSISSPINSCAHTPKALKNLNENGIQLSFSPSSYSPSACTPSTKFNTRVNSGQMVCGFGKSFTSCLAGDLINVKEYIESNWPNWRYLYDTLRNISLYIESTSIALAKCIVDKYSLPAPVPVANQTDTSVFVGRICPTNKTKSTPSVVSMQDLCVVENGKQNTIKELDLTQIKDEFTLFPGQVCAVRGITAGDKILASEFYASAPLPLPPPPNLKVPLKILVAAGPFTLTDTLSYEPLQDLVDNVVKNKPNLLILIGPLLDANHPKVVEGELAETFEEFCLRLIIKMENSFKDLTTKVVVIASSKDATNIPVYPTPAFVPETEFDNFKFFPDPTILNLDGLIIGVTATDSLFHIRKHEISNVSRNRLGVLASHIIKQQSFYPLYPPENDVTFDAYLWQNNCHFPVTPHLLLIPSDLHCFVNVIEGCIVVNPEKLTKGMAGGTYACIDILPQSSDEVWKTETHISVRILRI